VGEPFSSGTTGAPQRRADRVLSRFNPLRTTKGGLFAGTRTGIDIEERKQAEERVQKRKCGVARGNRSLVDVRGHRWSSQALGKGLAQAAKVAPMDSTVSHFLG